MEKKKELLFSLTEKNFEWSFSHGQGKGGQKRNKTLSAVHCHHKESGAHAYSQDGRSQKDNKIDAFDKLTKSPKFQSWLRLEIMRKSGEMADIDRLVDKAMEPSNLKIDCKMDGKWAEFNE